MIPVSRDAMLKLKGETDEEDRQKRIESIVQAVYTAAIRQARTSSDTIYRYQIPATNRVLIGERYVSEEVATQLGISPSDFHEKNIPEILTRLRHLFPDCTVMMKYYMVGQDGSLSELPSENLLPFVYKTMLELSVDWTGEGQTPRGGEAKPPKATNYRLANLP